MGSRFDDLLMGFFSVTGRQPHVLGWALTLLGHGLSLFSFRRSWRSQCGPRLNPLANTLFSVTAGVVHFNHIC